MRIKPSHKLLKNIVILVPLIGLVSACAPVNANTDVEKPTNASSVMHMSADTRAEIKAVLYDKYLGGQKKGDAALLKGAFHSDSIMFRPDKTEDGKISLRTWTDMHSVVEGWAKKSRPSMDFKNYEILSISAVDERMAVVLFKFNESVYDAMTLVKIDGEWQIAAKVYIEQ